VTTENLFVILNCDMDSLKKMVPGTRVTCKHECDAFYKKMCELWGIHRSRAPYNPFCKPVSVDSQNCHLINDTDFVATVKTDGERVLFMMTTHNGEPVAVLITSTMQFFEVDVFSDWTNFEQGLLADGELFIHDSGSTTVQFFDVMWQRGVNVTTSNFFERQSYLKSTFCVEDMQATAMQYYLNGENCPPPEFISATGKVVTDPKSPDRIHFETKVFVKPSMISIVEDGGVKLDGVIFNRILAGVETGRSKGNVFKWKMSPTIDLLSLADGLYAADDNDGHPTLFECDEVDTGGLFMSPNSVLEFVVRCEGDRTILSLFRERPDKQTPNSVSVCNRTVFSAKMRVPLTYWTNKK
jgi:hypothetical protein